MILKSEAIVLKSFDFRETSRIVTFFTKDYGKVKGILKGIRKDPKKFGSQADKFSVNDIVYYQHRNSDLHLVSQCDLRVYFFGIRKDLKKTLAASYILELVDCIMPPEEKNGEVYTLMNDYLMSLEGALDTGKLVHMFQVKILLYSGFKPHLDSCLECRKKIVGQTLYRDCTGQARFSLNQGGLICSQCESVDHNATLISPGAVASILHIERSDWPQCLRLTLSEPVKKELKYVLNNFLVFHLERRLKTTKYLG